MPRRDPAGSACRKRKQYATTGQKPSQGLRINGEKYTVLRTMPEPFTIYGKKVRFAAAVRDRSVAVEVVPLDGA